MTGSGPVQIADGVWWVGVRLPNDQFQCHAYLIENGDESVLLDPGSPLTIEPTLDSIQQVLPLDSIKYLVCHHPDPDIAAALPYLSDRLTRPDVEVVTEWRAQALLKHYGHRFDYYLVEEHDWAIRLDASRQLQFQLTPYLHFPGAMVSYDTTTGTLFSSDLFGGFVPDSAILISDDVDYIVENARPFHQHYMPSSELLTAALTRIQHRWPGIERIAPQHGHIIPAGAVAAVFEGLKSLDCGVFTLADADIDLQHLLRISQARTQINDALLTTAEPGALLGAINSSLASTQDGLECALFIDVPGRGWTMWDLGNPRAVHREPPSDWPRVDVPGAPNAALCVRGRYGHEPDEALIDMLRGLAPAVRPAINEYVEDLEQRRRESDLRRAAMTDPLTGLGNRRALEMTLPMGDYALLSLDLDRFKLVNDTFGHQAGDSVLSQMAAALEVSIRDDDRAYRLGGEEFLAVLPETTEESAKVVAERIRERVGALDLAGLAPGGRITVSVGIAVASDMGAEGFASVLSRADSALYASKEGGRDRVTVAV